MNKFLPDTILLVKANLRKNKGQAISFILLIFLAALMLNLGLVSAFGYIKNFDQKAEEFAAPDLTFIASGKEEKIIQEFSETLLKDKRTKQLETRDGFVAISEFDFGGNMQSRISILFHLEEHPNMGKCKIIEKSETSLEHGIYLPYLFQANGDYQIGDTYEMSFYTPTLPKKTISFQIAGFYEDIYFSTINSTTIGFLLEEEAYQYLEKEFDGMISGTFYAVKLQDKSEAELFTIEYFQQLSKKMGSSQVLDSNHYQFIKSARTLTASIGAMVIIGFSILLIFVSLIVVKFRISNTIEEEMQNIGVLEALGYTSKQVIQAFLLPFLWLAFLGFLLGILLAYLLLPFLSMVFALQTGILWNQGFSVSILFLTLAGIEFPVLLAAFFSLRKIRTLQPITAMRFGVLTHSFHKNYFPLAVSKGVLTMKLAGKSLLQHKKRNLLVGFILSGVTMMTVFAGVLYYNITLKTENFLTLAAGNQEDLRLEAENGETAKKLLEEAKVKPFVEEAILYAEKTVICEEKFEAISYISDDFEKLNTKSWNYQGRFARYENEVCIGALLAKQLGKQIGETIELSLGDRKESYLITGFIQGSNYLGHDLCITTEGYERLEKDFLPVSVSVYLEEEADRAVCLKEIEKTSNYLVASSNRQEMIKSSLGMYEEIVRILAKIIVAVTILVVIMVLYLVIKTVLNRRKKQVAIQKAIGFTTWQLVLENTFSFFPVIVFGILAGCVIGYFTINPFLSLLFSGIGIVKVDFEIPFLLLALIFCTIGLIGFFTSLLVSGRVRRVTPYQLILEKQ